MAYFDSVSASAPLIWWRMHDLAPNTVPSASYHRYWRVLTYETNGNDVVSIAELEMHNTVGGANVCASTGTINASSYYQNLAGFSPTRSFDGIIGTRWASNVVPATTPQWISYDFGAGNSASIVEVKVTSQTGSNWSTQSPTQFDVQYSDNNTSWSLYWSWLDLNAWTTGSQAKTINATSSPSFQLLDSGPLGLVGNPTQVPTANFNLISGTATGSNVAYFAGVPFSACLVETTGTTANWNYQTVATSAFNFINPFDTASNPAGTGWTAEFMVRAPSYNPAQNMMIMFIGNTDGFNGGMGIYTGGTAVGPAAGNNLVLSVDYVSGSHQLGTSNFGLDYQHVNITDGMWHHVVIATIYQAYPTRSLSYCMVDGRTQNVGTYANSWPSTPVPIPTWMQNYTASFPSFRFGVGNNSYNYYAPNSLYVAEVALYNRFLSASESLDHYLQLVVGSGTLSGTTYLLSSEPIYTVPFPGRAVVVPASGTGAGREARASKLNPGIN